ncbi:MAG: Coq4 family protein [Polyangiales bacterium]
MQFVQFEPRRALRAIRILASNPDDTAQVFTIVEALSGTTLTRLARRMQADASGAQLLASQPDIVARLSDRDALARLPAGSLGRAYLAFVERENITADGLRDADAAGRRVAIPPPLDFVNARLRDTHDLWHAATGYSGDVLGEASLLAFTFAQLWNPGIALIVVVALFKTLAGAPGNNAQARRTIIDGFRRGLKAKWLPSQPWENLLALPLDEVRRMLALEAPPVYREVRSFELKAA